MEIEMLIRAHVQISRIQTNAIFLWLEVSYNSENKHVHHNEYAPVSGVAN